MASMECMRILQEDTVEGSQWREILAGSLRSHDAAEPVRGMRHYDGCSKETIRSHATLSIKTGHWLDPYAKAKFRLPSRRHGLIRRRACGQQGGPNPLRMDI